MGKKLGDALREKAPIPPLPDAVYELVTTDLKRRFRAAAAVATTARIVVRKPDKITESEFTRILADQDHPYIRQFEKWLSREKLSMTVLGDVAFFTACTHQVASSAGGRSGPPETGGSDLQDRLIARSSGYRNDDAELSFSSFATGLERVSRLGGDLAKTPF